MSPEKIFEYCLLTSMIISFVWLSYCVYKDLYGKEKRGVPTFKNPPPPPRDKQWVLIERLLKDAEECENKGLYSDAILYLITAKKHLKEKRKRLFLK